MVDIWVDIQCVTRVSTLVERLLNSNATIVVSKQLNGVNSLLNMYRLGGPGPCVMSRLASSQVTLSYKVEDAVLNLS